MNEIQTELALRPGAAVGPLASLAQRAYAFIDASLSQNTHRAYASDWKHFVDFCERCGLDFLPATPETIVLYISMLASGDDGQPRKVATIERRLASIGAWHEARELDSPCKCKIVRICFKGIRRSIGEPQAQKAPLRPADLKKMIGLTPDTLKGARDTALLMIGFYSALRRSELASLNISDLQIGETGVAIMIRRSKVDSSGKGRTLVIIRKQNYCPVAALETYLAKLDNKEGPLFRKVVANKFTERLPGYSVARIIKRYAARIGLDHDKYSGHSMRAGFCTAAVLAGCSVYAIKMQTGHKSSASVDPYVRLANKWRDNATEKINL